MEQKDLVKGIELLASAFEAERNEKSSHLAEAFEKIGYDDPETFNLMVAVDHTLNCEAVIKAHFKNEELKSGIHAASNLAFLYMHWDFLDSHLKHFISEICGSPCCADRSRFILKGYCSYLKTGELFSLENKEDYRVVPFGSPQQWIDFITMIKRSYYYLPSYEDSKALRALDEEAKKYQAEEELKMRRYLKRKQDSVSEFAEFFKNRTPVLVTADDPEAGLIFCELLDTVLPPNENQPYGVFFRIHQYPGVEYVLAWNGDKVGMIDSAHYTGPTAMPFAQKTRKG